MLGNGSNNNDNKNFINLKLVATPGETTEQPKFVKLGDDFKETDETYTEMKGKLLKIKGTHTPPKGRMGDVYGFKAFFESENGEDIYVVESTISNASKDLLNALIVNIGTVLKVNLYLNRNGYPTSSVKLEDGNWAQTSMEYNQIDVEKLYKLVADLKKADEEKADNEEVVDNPF